MKKISIAVACLGLLLTTPSLANESKVLGSTTITFVGAIVEGGCFALSEQNTVKTSCWDGEEMKESQYKLKSNQQFNSQLINNKGSMNINWINDHLAVMNIVYN
ncbi:hypothetical protein [Proteus mirabilis]|uniref:hypothetical protein n=1 Tax=Proteus mirabilis TaxID=584 RepID=UPI0034E48532